MAGKSLHGGPERPLHEAVKEKPGLYWRPQDAGDDRAVGYLPRSGAYSEWNQFKREKCVAVSKAGRAEPSKTFDIRHRTTGFGVLSTRFQSCFGSVFHHYAPIHPFWNGNVHSLPLHVGCI